MTAVANTAAVMDVQMKRLVIIVLRQHLITGPVVSTAVVGVFCAVDAGVVVVGVVGLAAPVAPAIGTSGGLIGAGNVAVCGVIISAEDPGNLGRPAS